MFKTLIPLFEHFFGTSNLQKLPTMPYFSVCTITSINITKVISELDAVLLKVFLPALVHLWRGCSDPVNVS